MKKEFKILFLYPNDPQMGIAPSNLAILSACLKEEGFDTKLFDCTLYSHSGIEDTQDTLRSKLGQVKETEIDKLVKLKKTDIYDDFIKIVEEYNPNLIGVTVVDSTIRFALSFLDKIKNKNIPVIAGGVGVTFGYKKILSSRLVQYACIGEGEGAIVDLANKLYNNEETTQIKNIYTLDKNGNIISNPLRPLVNLDELPIPDFSIYEDIRFYRPFMGEVVRMLQMDLDRGCPFSCTYCAAPAQRAKFKAEGCGIYYRTKSVEKIFDEMKFLIKEYRLNFVWISSENLLSFRLEEFRKFAKRYIEEINLPLWCQNRLDTFTEEKTKLLAEMNCKNVSVGLEHGSEKIRNEILNKNLSNKKIINSIKLLAKYNLFPTLNNMIGIPDETRETIFETVKLNKQISKILKGNHNINVFTFIPFSGTKLREVCIRKGYIKDDDEIPISFYGESKLTMPSISKKELQGLEKTLTLYILLPKKYWNDIKIAEQDNEEGQKMYDKLINILKKIKK